MRARIAWLVVLLSLFAAGLWWWRDTGGRNFNAAKKESSAGPGATVQPIATAAATNKANSKHPDYRLSNTTRKGNDLLRDDRVVLLQNAVIDVREPEAAVPAALSAPTNSGTWIVVARNPLDNAFRSVLGAAGATIISYIPNNAELVRADASSVRQLKASPLVEAVLAYHPYYKLTDPKLLALANSGKDLPGNIGLRLAIYPGSEASTLAELKDMRAEVSSPEPGPFGVEVNVHPATGTFLDIARLDGVMVVEGMQPRRAANDLMRPQLGVSANTVTNANYLGLTGANILVGVADSGVDATHPDLSGRVFGDVPASLTDINGHGTHVTGTILGSGSESSTVGTNASGSTNTASFRGIAPGATALMVGIPMQTEPRNMTGFPPSDAYIQQTFAASNVGVANLSWTYDEDDQYDMHAASYDWAIRDSVPQQIGPQPVTYVMAAGNDGDGNSDGTGGTPDTIGSPGTSKNAITVSALEQLRNISNGIVQDGETNYIFGDETDSSNQVADLASRGNVGIGIEGGNGRYKPDLVAPGMFVVSDKSSSWDQGAYYNPSNYESNVVYNQEVEPGGLVTSSYVVQSGVVEVQISVFADRFSPSPFPELPIYVKIGNVPGTNAGQYDFLGTGTVTMPPDLPLTAGTEIYFSVGNTNTNQPVSFNTQVLLISTNDNGNYLTVLSNLNNNLGPYYRYESGTSMSAAAVSGMVALMEQYLQNNLGVTNPSPALLKALLINGARSVNALYDFNVQAIVNSQGWGLPNLSNSIPGSLVNGGSARSLWYYDQSLSNALATGQSQTQMIHVGTNAMNQPLRMTLVYTDPPGNPAAGVKLVNNLDLIVTNLDTGDVYYGNDIPSGSVYNQTEGTNPTPVLDAVNNVQNVYLYPPVGTNYSVTVTATRVNVNAVTANTTAVVQDYALVISSGDGGSVSNALTMPNNENTPSNGLPNVTVVTSDQPILGQRAGGNFQYSPSPNNGILNQWNFYVFTNTGTNSMFTNVAFITFSPVELGVPRMGAYQTSDPANGVRQAADVDLYVSTDPTLTNLNPTVISNALANINNSWSSVSRTGSQQVLITNSMTNEVYYVGVKSEDQQGAQYGFLGVDLTNSFYQTLNGNVELTTLTTLPTNIPGGTPNQPSSLEVFAVTALPVQARKLVVEDNIAAQEFGDYVGAVTFGGQTTVLNNHGFFTNVLDPAESFTYDDTGELDTNFPNSRGSDGPGSLTQFIGQTPSTGPWIFSMVNDSSPYDLGSVNGLNIFVVPQTTNDGTTNLVPADSWFYDYVDVPPGATNLTVTVGLTSTNPLPVQLYLRRSGLPTLTEYDKYFLVQPPGTNYSLSIYDSPPLNPGTYYIGVYNPNAVPEEVTLSWQLQLSPSGATPVVSVTTPNEPILDDAVTLSTNYVGQASIVDSVDVGVRLNHPRVSDLVLTLISPSGTRVLLQENRGGNTADLGSGVNTTNYVGAFTTGTYTPTNTVIPVGVNGGTLLIDYNFYTIKDDMRVYYGGTRIFDSGLVNGAGTFSVNFGPGTATNVTIDMNEPGTNPNGTNGDAWEYQVSEITQSINYEWFTENTNLTTTPIKFAIPPFGQAAPLPSSNVLMSSFETVPAQSYASGSTVEGWTVSNNPVTVVSVGALAGTEGNTIEGSQVLALHNGTITRNLPTVVGSNYTLSFVSHGRPLANGPLGWWKGEGMTVDSSGNNNTGIPIGSASASYTNGEVGQSLDFNGSDGIYAANNPTLNPTNQITTEAWIDTFGSGAQIIFGKVGQPFPGTGNAGYEFGLNNKLLFAQFNSFSGQAWPAYAVGAPSPVPVNTWTHVAWTYNANVMDLYINGQLVASNVIGAASIADWTNRLFISGTDNNNQYFNGAIDEATLYSNALSIVQIQDIYAAGSAGKQAVDVNGSVSAAIQIGGFTNGNFSAGDGWVTNYYTFTAVSTNTPVTIQSQADGMLVDAFQLNENPGPNPLNYYLPEEPLTKLAGENSQGNWQLEILDNRAGATNPTPTLISWELSMILDRVVPAAIPLTEAITNTNTVPAGFIQYYVVSVPPWAMDATNTLITASAPVNLLFNATNEPGNGGNDSTLLSGVTTGIAPLTSASLPPLPTGEYYLGVQNTGANPVTFSIVVNFDITPLTNMVPYSSSLPATTVPRYFQYDVSSNATAVAFELTNQGGSLNMVASLGAPLPTESSYAYQTGITTGDATILVSSNSTPVTLTPGRWYLGVFNHGTAAVNYIVEAVELGPPTIIVLTNNEALTNTFSPAQALTTFFEFAITNDPSAALFELYQMNGNVDLTLDNGIYPYAPPYFMVSANSGTNGQQIVIRTNELGMSINGTWYLSVPNNTGSNVTFTIHAVEATNGLLLSDVPLRVGVSVNPASGTGPTLTWSSVTGEMYEIDTSPNLVNWTMLTTVVAGGDLTSYTDPTPITGIPVLYYRIEQIPSP